MNTTRVAIVGAGVAGLYAAYLLERQGIRDYVVLEARTRPGGRILSASHAPTPDTAESAGSSGIDRFDLGPTWFWPALQPELDALITQLGLARFAQHETGDMVAERSLHEGPMRMRGYATSPQSVRLAGGMAALTDALQRQLPPSRLALGMRVRQLRRTGAHVELSVENVDEAQGQRAIYRAEQVLLAVPPRLALASIEFAPELPAPLARAWHRTATWMAAHAKYVAVYDAPFWRDRGLSGEARSACGPLVEIHDASMPGGRAALFGFFGLAAHARRRLSDDALREHCRAQLTRLFGEPAARPREEFVKDWSADPLTATADDLSGPAEHAAAPAATAGEGVWRDALVGIASEWSPQFPGYVAGAIEAAGAGVRAVLGDAPYNAVKNHRR